MPLFVITIVYGLLWKRTNWQGAVAGFLSGGAVGMIIYFRTPKEHMDVVRNLMPIISSSVALIVTPIVSILTARHTHETDHIWEAFVAKPSSTGESDTFHLIPQSFPGRVGMTLVVLGFVTFMAGVLSVPLGFHNPSTFAVGGMMAVFVGGLLRVYSE